MSSRENQPAVMRRKIEHLEALLEAEREQSEKLFQAYREGLYAKVDAELKLKRIKEVMDGAWE